MKTLVTILISFFSFNMVGAQMPGMMQPRGGQSMNVGHFYGKVQDENGKPMSNASVQLSQNRMDTATGKRRDFVVAISMTNAAGEFSIDKLPIMGNYELLITAVGYAPLTKKIAFELKRGGDMSQMAAALDRDLGNIKMNVDAQQLEGVTVTANKGMLQMGIDRKVFNVDKSLTSLGGTAVDVMKNVPSVNVDIDGNVTLRNSAPQLFVDGRPTTMTLEQIPAEEIESIEIITNPSAKFDASGGGSGILNVILKKNRKPGYNGNIRASVDSRGGTGFGGNINVKQGKVNFFANTMINNRVSQSDQKSARTDYVDNVVTNFIQTGTPKNNGNFAFGRAGLDYLIDNRNTLTISGVLVGGKFNNNNEYDIFRDTTIGNYYSKISGLSNSKGTSNFNNYGAQMSFKHNFAKPNKNITADMNYNYSKNSNEFGTSTEYFDNAHNITGIQGKQKSNGSGDQNNFTAQMDYTNPINDLSKIEMGVRGSVRNYNSENHNYFYDANTGKYIPIVSLSSQYKYTDQVYAGYVTYSRKIKNFSFQAGGRIESSFYEGSLVGSNQKFDNSFPFSFFPSLYLTQKLTETQDMQLNYSRKINRPNFFQLIPYYDYSDSLNISKGNPALLPEFTNLVELSYQNNIGKGNNLIVTAYYRNTTDLITNYTYRDENPNKERTDSIFINTFRNASSSEAYGLELTSSNRIAKWWSLTANVNLYNSAINGANLEDNLNNNLVSWFGKLNNTFVLPYNFNIQLSGDYTSKTILPPGRGGGGGRMMMYGGGNLATANGYTEPVYGVDIAVKKDFLKDKSASVSLSMNDIFRTKVYRVHSESVFSKSIYTYQDNERRRDPQVLRLSLSWRFGKMDASLFKRKNMRAEQEGMQSGMDGMGNQ